MTIQPVVSGIQEIAPAEIPRDFFSDPWHHVIQRSLIQTPRPNTAYYAGPGPSYAIYEPDLGFGYYDPTGMQLEAWANWVSEARLPMLAGETHSHYALLQQMGAQLAEDSPLQIFCRYEAQDFCVHDGAMPGVKDSTLKLKQATPADLDKLYYFYSRSETMQARSRESLLHTIQHNKLFFLQKLGKTVSAALTHCESDSAALIGGVYTPAIYRGKGYGYLCVHALLAALKDEGKTPVLFYEKNNSAARKLYQKLGFRPNGEWMLIELTYEESKG